MSDEYSLMQQRLRETAYRLWEEAGSPEGEDERLWFQAKLLIEREEASLDRELAESFPASDPASSSGVTDATDMDRRAGAVIEQPGPAIEPGPGNRRGWAARYFRAWWLFPARE